MDVQIPFSKLPLLHLGRNRGTLDKEHGRNAIFPGIQNVLRWWREQAYYHTHTHTDMHAGQERTVYCHYTARPLPLGDGGNFWALADQGRPTQHPISEIFLKQEHRNLGKESAPRLTNPKRANEHPLLIPDWKAALWQCTLQHIELSLIPPPTHSSRTKL